MAICSYIYVNNLNLFFLYILFRSHRWINNLMLKFKAMSDSVENNTINPIIENLIFIDFQYSCWTSPAIDLHYFFNNSLQESLRHSRFDELIELYHSHLQSTLKRLKFKKSIPTLDQFKQQYLDKQFYGNCVITSFKHSRFYYVFETFRLCCIVFSTTVNDK